MQDFLVLSRLLTGLTQLATAGPQSVEVRMAQDYLRLIREQFGPGYDTLLLLFQSVAGRPDPLKSLLDDPGFQGAAEIAAKQIVNLWMLSQYTDTAGKTADGGFFEKGSVWAAIKAHPIGFSHRSYGYWAGKP